MKLHAKNPHANAKCGCLEHKFHFLPSLVELGGSELGKGKSTSKSRE